MGKVTHYIKDVSGNLRTLQLKTYHVPSSKHRIIATSEVLRQYEGESFSEDSDGLTLSGINNNQFRRAIFALRNKSSSLLVSITHHYGKNTTYFVSDPESRTDHHLKDVCEEKVEKLMDKFHKDEDKLNNSVFNVLDLSSINISTVSNDNINLAPAEKELLRWHCRLAHISFAKVQHLMRAGSLANTEATRRLHRVTCNLPPVKCSACLFAKQRTRSSPGTKHSTVKDKVGALRNNDLHPGQKVSLDHFVCSTNGRLFSSRGKTAEKNTYSGGALFVDHASSYIHPEFQTVLSSHATIIAKTSFEGMCRDHGVIPQKYLTDNATAFTSKEYTAHLNEFRQVNRFAGVGAHHHNGIAERSIQTIMSITRAMMLHAAIHWPDMADTRLWPMAVTQACFIWNHMPDLSTGLSPTDIFTKIRWPTSKFHDTHVWGCPVYVLDKRIADGKKIPKWKPRSHRSVNLGVAPSYASSIPLCLNPETGSITPQFHVVFDDWFATIASDPADMPDFHSEEWQKLFGDSSFQYLLDPADVSNMQDLSTELENSIDSANADQARNRVMEAAERLCPPTLTDPAPSSSSWREKGETSTISNKPPSTPITHPRFTEPSKNIERNFRQHSSSDTLLKDNIKPVSVIPSNELLDESNDLSNLCPINQPTNVPHPTPTSKPLVNPSLSTNANPSRCSNRRTKQTQHYYTVNLAPASHFNHLFNAIECPYLPKVDISNAFVQEKLVNVCLKGEEIMHSILAAKKKSDPDLFTFDEAMASEDRELWIASAEKEITELEAHGVWTEVPLHSVKGQVIPSTWVFRVKRGSDGTIKRRKGRICLRRDLMRGITDTYSPVVAFPTVRLFLIVSIILKWTTCSIDFSNAFVQAKRVDNVYMKVPRGFRTIKPGHVLKLIRSLYGAKDAPKLWFELLSKALRSEGFTQSKIDLCL